MQRGIFRISVSLIFHLFVSSAFGNSDLPPNAPKIPFSTTLFGDTRTDDYHWMLTYPGEKHSKNILDYLNAENDFALSWFKPYEKQRQDLVGEMINKAGGSSATAPEQVGNYLYYSRVDSGNDYQNIYRKRVDSGKEEVVIDLNGFAKIHPYVRLNTFQISPDAKKIAYSIIVGSLKASLYVKDFETGLVETIANENSGWTTAWSADSSILLYPTLNETKRSAFIYRHRLGTSSDSDQLVYEEKDQTYSLKALRNTRDGKFIVFSARNQDMTSEVFYLASDQVGKPFKSFAPRTSKINYSVEHRGAEFYILSNHKSQNMGVYVVSDNDTALKNWKPFKKPSSKRVISQVIPFRNYLVLLEREGGLPKLEIHDFRTRRNTPVEFSDAAYQLTLQHIMVGEGMPLNIVYDTKTLFVDYSSLRVADRTYKVNLESRAKEVVRHNSTGNLDPGLFKSERIWVKVRDGARVPVALVYRNDVKLDGSAPLLLQAYGSYGTNFSLNDPAEYMIPVMVPLLQRGMIIAVSFVRGGGELGPKWAIDGRLKKKRNTFNDFIDCGRYLIDQKYTSASRLGIRGLSAGGLLIGAVLNQHPELFRAAVARSPFVDLLNTGLDEKIPFTKLEWSQWGDPKKRDDYRYMRGYAPYDNIGHHNYPAIFIEGSLLDNQVLIHEPAKFVAKMREYKTGENDLLFRVNMTGAHGGDSGIRSELNEQSYEVLWLLKELGA